MARLLKWRRDQSLPRAKKRGLKKSGGDYKRVTPWADGIILYHNCTSVHILVVAQYSSFAVCYHWGKLSKV